MSSSDEEEGINKSHCIELCQQIEELQLELKELEIDLNKQKSANALVKKDFVWDISFKDGKVLLGTEIKDIQEIPVYEKILLSYLSPFGHTSQTLTITFEQIGPNLMHRLVSALTTDTLAKEGQKNTFQNNLLIKCLQPDIYLDGLVNTYFQCFNNIVPIVHENTFRKHYELLKNKMDDPITLAICTTACTYTCPHSNFATHEKRYFGEYFYNRCMDKLVDMFDEPENYLESLIVINSLQRFMITTLRVNEYRKWTTIAAILATNLKEIYPEYKEGSKQQNYSTRVLYAIIHRNCLVAHVSLALAELCINERDDLFDTFFEFVDVLPDEAFAVQKMLELVNHIGRLESHFVTRSTYRRVRHSFIKKTVDWVLEDILCYEKIVINWWQTLPEQFKLSTNPFSCTKEEIENCFDPHKLIMCIYIHTMTIDIQANFLSPKLQNNVHQIIREKAIHLTFYATEIVLALSKQFEKVDNICFSSSWLLVRSIDTIMSLMCAKDDTLTSKTKMRIEEYMNEFKKSISPDHHVLPSTSQLSTISWTDPKFPMPAQDLYKQYPLPCDALIFDIVHSSFMDLTKL